MFIRRASILLNLTVLLSVLPASSTDIVEDTSCVLRVFKENADSCVLGTNLHFGLKHNKKIGAEIICCATRWLETCILDRVEEQCGASRRHLGKILSYAVLNTLSQVSRNKSLDCDWNDSIIYDSRSPVCWPIWARGLGIGLLAPALLSFVIACVWKCGRKVEPKKVKTQKILTPLHTYTPSNNVYTISHTKLQRVLYFTREDNDPKLRP